MNEKSRRWICFKKSFSQNLIILKQCFRHTRSVWARELSEADYRPVLESRTKTFDSELSGPKGIQTSLADLIEIKEMPKEAEESAGVGNASMFGETKKKKKKDPSLKG